MKLIWVTEAQYLNDFKIKIIFNDGITKIVNLEKHLDMPIFQSLKDKDFFKDFRLNPFTIEWKNGVDFAPEFLYNIEI